MEITIAVWPSHTFDHRSIWICGDVWASTHAFHSVTLRTVYIMNGASQKEAKTSQREQKISTTTPTCNTNDNITYMIREARRRVRVFSGENVIFGMCSESVHYVFWPPYFLSRSLALFLCIILFVAPNFSVKLSIYSPYNVLLFGQAVNSATNLCKTFCFSLENPCK